MVVGPPYAQYWTDTSGESLGDLFLYSSDHWPDAPAGGVPVAPEPFLQEHDIRVPFARMFDLGAVHNPMTKHPARIPAIWPFTTVV